jgi:hypothetical protein
MTGWAKVGGAAAIFGAAAVILGLIAMLAASGHYGRAIKPLLAKTRAGKEPGVHDGDCN